jgi:hypothetical protein
MSYTFRYVEHGFGGRNRHARHDAVLRTFAALHFPADPDRSGSRIGNRPGKQGENFTNVTYLLRVAAELPERYGSPNPASTSLDRARSGFPIAGKRLLAGLRPQCDRLRRQRLDRYR